jgi:hypothetical protein
MASEGVLIKVVNDPINPGRIEITVDPWLREVTRGEEITWTLDNPNPNALVANWSIVDKPTNAVGRPGKRGRAGLRGLGQADVIWATQPIHLPSVNPPQGGNPNIPAVQDGDIESYSIHIDLNNGTNITLDPDYRVRP